MQTKTPTTVLALAMGTALALAAGCSDDGGAGTQRDAAIDAGTEPVDASVDAAPDAWVNNNVNWEECPLYPDNSPPRVAECGLVDLPLRAAEPEGPTIEIWVQRLRGTSSQKRGQIWFLYGGPGGSGAAYAGTMDQ